MIDLPDQTFKLFVISTRPVLDILNLAWSVKFGKKVNLWNNAPDKDPVQIKNFAQKNFSHHCGNLVDQWY